MSESSAPYEGVHERNQRHQRVLERIKAEDPELYEELFGEHVLSAGQREMIRMVPCHCDEAYVNRGLDDPACARHSLVDLDGLADLVRDKETAERALLKSWRELHEVDGWGCYHCEGPLVLDSRDFNHAPDCLIPPLLERYGEG